MNRGLIEASGRGRKHEDDPRLPRFMNRGLIEAGFARASEGVFSNFPDS